MFGFGKRRVEKLDFLVAGAQKSGTTALNYYLKRHPQIALPIKKELHFFDNDELFAGGNVSYEPLHEMFQPARPGSIAGENTPIYLYWLPALPRIRDYNPAMKFFVILRHPIERAFRLFPRERFLVIKYEEFRARQRETMETVFRFLNLSPTRFRPVEAHDIPYARKIRDEERAAVREILQSDIGRLETLLGWDCSDWR